MYNVLPSPLYGTHENILCVHTMVHTGTAQC